MNYILLIELYFLKSLWRSQWKMIAIICAVRRTINFILENVAISVSHVYDWYTALDYSGYIWEYLSCRCSYVKLSVRKIGLGARRPPRRPWRVGTFFFFFFPLTLKKTSRCLSLLSSEPSAPSLSISHESRQTTTTRAPPATTTTKPLESRLVTFCSNKKRTVIDCCKISRNYKFLHT